VISIKMENYDQVLGAFNPSIVDRALSSALNKTAAKARTKVSSEIRTVWNLSAGEIKKSSWLNKARPMSWSRPVATISYSGRKLGMYHFKPTVRKNRSVTVKVLKRAPRQPARHESGRPGFFMVLNGGKNIWARTGEPKRAPRGGRYKGKDIKREPITVLKVRSIPQMISKRVIRKMDKQIDDDFPIIFAREMTFMQDRASKKQAKAIASAIF
jgi:hypothetical protein